MMYTNARYNDLGAIYVDLNGETITVPGDMGTRHRREMAEMGVTIAPYVERVPTHEELSAQLDAIMAQFDKPAWRLLLD